MNIQKMMKQAQEMQSKMAEIQAKLEAQEIEGTSGGGAVKIRLNGKHQMLALSLDASIVNPAEKDVLEDMIVAAYNDAKGKIDSNASTQMSQLTSGLSLPPGLKLPF